MRKIAVFTSSAGDSADRLVSLFNEGNRLRVDLIVTDREDSGVAERFAGKEVDVEFIAPGRWQEAPEEVVALLSARGIELIAVEEFGEVIPDVVAHAFEGRIVNLTDAEEAPREVVAAFARIDGETAEKPVAPEPKNVDEEWAETLHLNYDESRLRQTPPPVPGQEPPTPPHQEQQQPQGLNTGQGQRPQPNFFQQELRRAMQCDKPMPSTYMVWAIIMTILCCTVPGIVAIIYSAQVSAKYNIGDYEGAEKASRNAQIWIIVSFVLGVLNTTLYLPIALIG